MANILSLYYKNPRKISNQSTKSDQIFYGTKMLAAMNKPD